MSRRYADAVQVRTDTPGTPEQFLWRGRLYVVSSVLSHWVEVGAWWRSAARTLEGRGEVLPGPDIPSPVPSSKPSEMPSEMSPAPPHGSPGLPAGLPSPAERQVWRVEASSGRSSGTGVYDLACDSEGRAWQLARALD